MSFSTLLPTTTPSQHSQQSGMATQAATAAPDATPRVIMTPDAPPDDEEEQDHEEEEEEEEEEEAMEMDIDISSPWHCIYPPTPWSLAWHAR
jgi:hypothetical protein